MKFKLGPHQRPRSRWTCRQLPWLLATVRFWALVFVIRVLTNRYSDRSYLDYNTCAKGQSSVCFLWDRIFCWCRASLSDKRKATNSGACFANTPRSQRRIPDDNSRYILSTPERRISLKKLCSDSFFQIRLKHIKTTLSHQTATVN